MVLPGQRHAVDCGRQQFDPHDAIVEPLDQFLEHGVSGEAGNHPMELAVGPQVGRGRVIGQRGHRGVRLTQLKATGIGDPARGEPCSHGLQTLPYLVGRDRLVHAEFNHAHTTVRFDGDEPFLRQSPDCLTDRRAGYLQFRRQLLLSQPLARQQTAAQQLPAKVFIHSFADRAGALKICHAIMYVVYNKLSRPRLTGRKEVADTAGSCPNASSDRVRLLTARPRRHMLKPRLMTALAAAALLTVASAQTHLNLAMPGATGAEADPHLTSNMGAHTVSELTSDTLILYEDGQYVPALAHTWETSEDGLQHT